MNIGDEFWTATLTPELIRCLFALASMPFEMTLVAQKWSDFGWRHTPQSDDEYGFRVKISDDLDLIVAPNEDEIDCMILTFCYWPEYDEEFAESQKIFFAERKRFGDVYENALELTQQVLGPPHRVGQDTDEYAHRHAVWLGTHGWLILQQAAFDTQFGLEVNFWIEPTRNTQFEPTPPLIDWLISRSSPPM